MNIALAMIGFVAVIGLLILFITRSASQPAKSRQQAIESMASMLGLRYIGEDPSIVGMGFDLLDGFVDCEHATEGDWLGTPVMTADAWAPSATPDAASRVSPAPATRRYRSVVVARSPTPLPHLLIAREGPVADHIRRLANTSLDFESEGFNRAFHVRADDASAATALIDGRMIEWLMTMEPEDLLFETGWAGVLVCRGPILEPSDVVLLVEIARGFLEHVPPVVLDNDIGEGSGRGP